MYFSIGNIFTLQVIYLSIGKNIYAINKYLLYKIKRISNLPLYWDYNYFYLIIYLNHQKLVAATLGNCLRMQTMLRVSLAAMAFISTNVALKSKLGILLDLINGLSGNVYLAEKLRKSLNLKLKKRILNEIITLKTLNRLAIQK